VDERKEPSRILSFPLIGERRWVGRFPRICLTVSRPSLLPHSLQPRGHRNECGLKEAKEEEADNNVNLTEGVRRDWTSSEGGQGA